MFVEKSLHFLNSKSGICLMWKYQTILIGLQEKCSTFLPPCLGNQPETTTKKLLGSHPAAAAAAAKSLQSCLTLCDPRDGSPPGSSVPGILQARTLEWGAISFSSAWKWKVKVKSLSRVRLPATPWTAAHQAPPSMGFSRQEYCSRVLSPSPSHPSRLWKCLFMFRYFSLSLFFFFLLSCMAYAGFPGGSVVKNLPAELETEGSIPGSGRSPGGGNVNPLQYSCLGNPMDRGAWQAIVHGVAKSWTQLSN